MMKNFNNIAMAIIALAVVVLYVLHFTTSKADSKCDMDKSAVVKPSAVVFSDSTKCGKSACSIVYVDVAKMQECLQKFDFFKNWNEQLLQKEAKSTKELKTAQTKLQAEVEVFQQKYQSGGFLTKESLEQEQNRLMKKDQELQSLQMHLEQDFAKEQINLSNQLMDTIDVFFKYYNEDRNYMLILNRAEVLYGDESMDITDDVLEKLNERYSKPVK